MPLFYERGDDGIPHGWLTRVKASLRTICPNYCASRMVDQYMRQVYDPADPTRVPPG